MRDTNANQQREIQKNYNILYISLRAITNRKRKASRLAQTEGQECREFWTFIWYNPKIKPVSIDKQAKWHYFADHDAAYWRSNWKDDATAFAFKSGPPEGHAAAQKLIQFPDWRLSSGHAHPDAGSFIIWANGKYLTGDSGYAGIPLTEHHNTLVFDKKGQAKKQRTRCLSEVLRAAE